MAQQAADALAHLHAINVVHGGAITPNNIIRSRSGVYKLSDIRSFQLRSAACDGVIYDAPHIAYSAPGTLTSLHVHRVSLLEALLFAQMIHLRAQRIAWCCDRSNFYAVCLHLGCDSMAQCACVSAEVSKLDPSEHAPPNVTDRSDVWALAACLLHAWKGSKPYDGLTLAQIVRQQIEGYPPSFGRITCQDSQAPRPGGRAVQRILQPCFATDPKQRPSAHALCRQLCSLSEQLQLKVVVHAQTLTFKLSPAHSLIEVRQVLEHEAKLSPIAKFSLRRQVTRQQTATKRKRIEEDVDLSYDCLQDTLADHDIQSGDTLMATEPTITSGHVHIKSLTGKTTCLGLLSTDMTVDAVMAMIQDKDGVPPDQQRLIYEGRLIGHPQMIDVPLCYRGVLLGTTPTTMHLVLGLRGC
jgi:serine/threonine protein kinase